MKKMNLTVNGTPYEVEVGDLTASPIAVSVNGKSYNVSLESSSAASVPVAVSVPVTVQAPVSAPVAVAAAPVAAAGSNVLIAPMPGVIHKVAVKVGDKVTRGQELCSLEAMKMKNSIRSPRDGVIASVEVVNEQKVVYGAVIVRFA